MTLTAQALDQRMDALHRANEIRTARASLKRDLKARRVDLVELVEDPPEWLLTARIETLLRATPKVGHVKAARILRRLYMSTSTTVGGLTIRQRGALTAELGRLM